MLMAALTVAARPSANHYAALNNKSGINLWNAINSCTQQGYHDLSYDGLLTAYQQTDVDNNGRLIDMYGGCSFSFSNSCGSYHGECDCYNREHSLPKSWWGGSPKSSKQGSDIFHVVPTDGYVNNRRSSYAFGEVGGTPTYQYNGNKLGSSGMSGYSGTVFEPQDEYKGDFARGYMGVMAKWELNATSGAGAAIFNGTYTAGGHYGLTAYGMALLMKWHRQDPVSEKELRRNDAIEATQGNRNPFIDYPELAEYLWGTHAGETVVLADLTSAYDGYVPVIPVIPDNPDDPDDPDDPLDPDDPDEPVAAAGDYAKVTTNLSDWTGIYLAVYEGESVCLNGAVAAVGGDNGAKVTVTIQDNTIAASEAVNSYALIVAAEGTGYSLRTSNGLYLGNNSKKLVYSANPVAYSITHTGSEVLIKDGSNYALKFNTGTHYFRFYQSGQGPVQLYRKVVTETPTAVPYVKDDRESASGARKELRGGHLYIVLQDGTRYSASGLRL